MRSLTAFLKKEFSEQIRSGRLTVLGILFVIFGIMNPAVAKLTPWLLEIMSDSLAESGMTVGEVTVTAMDSWVQFFKNIPMALIIFVLLQGGIFTKEYGSGTLVLSLTKGLERYKVVVSKAVTLTLLWTVGYWLCFWVTYAYNAYYWDNSIAQNLALSAVCWWLFGVFTVSLMTLFSALFLSNSGVLLATGATVLGSYLLSLLPKLSRFMPTLLMDGTSLIYGYAEAEKYLTAIAVATAVGILCFALSIPVFNKKQF